MLSHTNYSKEEINKILYPKDLEQESGVNRYKDIIFYYYIIDKIKSYATKTENRVLLKFIELGKLNSIVMEQSLNNEEFLKSNELTINIKKYVDEFLLKSNEFEDFKNDKAFQFENLLNNVKMFDNDGKTVDIVLTMAQKDIIIKQYNESFADNIKGYIENNPDEFQELYIANTCEEFKRLFPETYIESIKDESLKKFNTDKTMGVVRYRLAYEDKLKSIISEKYVNNENYKSLLVFNNIDNEIIITKENIKEKEKEKEVKQEIKSEVTKEKPKSFPMSIVMKLPENITETYKGIYLPISDGLQIYIPKPLYKITEDEIELINSKMNTANMSEYTVNTEERIRTFKDRLTFKDFCDKYSNFYKVKLDQMKEVVV